MNEQLGGYLVPEHIMKELSLRLAFIHNGIPLKLVDDKKWRWFRFWHPKQAKRYQATRQGILERHKVG